jgi:TATA-box binding protein (TBP) (component of TFIID and TFIIIB)
LCGSFGAKGFNAKDIHKEMVSVYSGKTLLCKAVHNWVEKFSQGRSKVTDDVQEGRTVETATEVTVQWVEESIRADRRIMIDSVATTLGCSHGLSYSNGLQPGVGEDILRVCRIKIRSRIEVLACQKQYQSSH